MFDLVLLLHLYFQQVQSAQLRLEKASHRIRLLIDPTEQHGKTIGIDR